MGKFIDGFEIESGARSEWAAEPSLRREFADDFETYLAWKVASACGRVRFVHQGARRYSAADAVKITEGSPKGTIPPDAEQFADRAIAAGLVRFAPSLDSDPGKLELKSAGFFVAGTVDVKGQKISKRQAADAFLEIRRRAIAIQDSKEIDFGEALGQAEKELSALSCVLDQYEAQTGQCVPMRAV